ncbi:MAG: glycosyltransferase family 8 protein [Clostridia bacterium]|nr:glycosyltransferase family 8 protein [Clostridia bacterium]
MISLLYCGNEKVFKGLLISALSIAENTEEALDVHVLTMDLREENPAFRPINTAQAKFIEAALQKENSESRVVLHDATELFRKMMADSPNMENFYTPYAFLRLFADEIEGMPERIIYLDTDTVARGDISPLFAFDLCGCDYAGAKDFLGKFFINPRYINSGVLLLNIKQIRKSGLFRKARMFCATKKTAFPDQDAINRLVSRKCFFPSRFNEQYAVRKDTVVRHFSKTLRLFPFFHTINVKPWDIDGIHKKFKTHEFDEIIYKCLALAEEFEKQHYEERQTI